MHAITGPVDWPAGPPTEQVAELVRTLELTINRRLDGVLHGNHQGITPGHGSEPGEARLYQPGDDVRRIDWNVTARTQETHVREQIADRDLEAWLVVDTSAAMRFGTTVADKAQVALAAAAGVGFLTARNQNRLGAVLVAGPAPQGDAAALRARPGARRAQRRVASPPPSEGLGRADLAAAHRPGRRGQPAARVRRRRSPTSPATTGSTRSPGSGLRHDLLAITVHDPRELDVPPVGLVEVVDPATGRRREVRVTRRRAAPLRRSRRRGGRARAAARMRRAGADLIELATDGDWLADDRPATSAASACQAVNAQVLRRMTDDRRCDVPQPRAPVVAARRRRAGRRLRRRPALAAPGDASASRRSTCSTASRRPGRAGAATSSPALQLLGLAAGVVAIARPIDDDDRAHRERGPHPRAVRRVAVDDGHRRRARPARGRQGGGPRLRRPGRAGHRGRADLVQRRRSPSRSPRRSTASALDQGIEDLELAESTAIGDALATGTELLTQLADDPTATASPTRRATRSPRARSCC